MTGKLNNQHTIYENDPFGTSTYDLSVSNGGKKDHLRANSNFV